MSSRRSRAAACILLPLLFGCQAEAPGSEDGASSPSVDGTIGIEDAATPRPDVDLTGCSELAPLASPEALAATPRDLLNIEQLALNAGNSFTAEQWIYDRLLDDLPRIRSAVPEIADIEYHARYERFIYIETEYNLTYQMQTGVYSAWNCLNALYGVSRIHYALGDYGFDLVYLHFDAIYDLETLAEQYAALPDLEDVRLSRTCPETPTICVTVDGEVFHYIFDDGGGSCNDMGTPWHDYTYIRTQGYGATPVRVGQWDDRWGTPPPAWVASFTPCL